MSTRWKNNNNNRFSQFKGRHYFDSSSHDNDIESYRAPISNSDSSNDWRSTEDVSSSVSASNSSFSSSLYLNDAQVFRNYRSKHWKSNYKNKLSNNGGNKHTSFEKKKNKCRHSYGIICKRFNKDEYLVLHRRYSIGMEEMIRAKWELTDITLLRSLCTDMSMKEREEFSNITNFRNMWMSLQLKADDKMEIAESKIQTLLNGYRFDPLRRLILPDIAESANSVDAANSTISAISTISADTISVNWQKICDTCTTHYEKTPLEFPKGRREKKSKITDENETDIECAKREFFEETNITEDQYILHEEVAPLREKFIGINGCRYIYVYFLAEMKDNKDNVGLNLENKNQMNEVGEINWYSSDDILSMMRPCDKDRKQVFENALRNLR